MSINRGSAMNPLVSIWLFVFITMSVVTLVIWLAENYFEYLSNFWVLSGLFLGAVALYHLISWIWNRLHRPSA